MIDPHKLFSVPLLFFQVTDSNGEFFLKSSELFESPVYLEEVADVLCILQAGTQLLWGFFFSVILEVFDEAIDLTSVDFVHR